MKTHKQDKADELVEAFKERLQQAPQFSPKEEKLARLLVLAVEVRGGGVPHPFEASLTQKGAEAILASLQEK